MTVRQTTPQEIENVRSFYTRCGYPGGALPDDVILCAEDVSVIIGVVRLAIEHGVTMLRGMQVDPAYHRRGIGTRLLKQFETLLNDRADCYCIPFRHLIHFYGAIGFKEIDLNEAPPHLIERLANYRKDRLDMIVMKRDRIMSKKIPSKS